MTTDCPRTIESASAFLSALLEEESDFHEKMHIVDDSSITLNVSILFD